MDKALVWSIVGAVIVVPIALWGISASVRDFRDPCHFWNQGPGDDSPGSANCPNGYSGTSSSKTGELLRVLVVQVAGVVAAVLAVTAAIARRLLPMAGAALLLGVMFPPLMLSLAFVVPLTAGIAFFVAAADVAKRDPSERTLPLRFAGGLAIVVAALAISLLARGTADGFLEGWAWLISIVMLGTGVVALLPNGLKRGTPHSVPGQ